MLGKCDGPESLARRIQNFPRSVKQIQVWNSVLEKCLAFGTCHRKIVVFCKADGAFYHFIPGFFSQNL
jgi:hypothetical protein